MVGYLGMAVDVFVSPHNINAYFIIKDGIMKKYCYIFPLIITLCIGVLGSVKSEVTTISEDGFDSILLEQIKEVKHQIEKDPLNAGLRVRYTQLLITLGKYQEAERVASEVFYSTPGNIEVLLNYVTTLFLSGKYEAMLPILERCREISPHHPAILDLMSKYYNKMGNKEKELSTLLELVPLVKGVKEEMGYGENFLNIATKEGVEFTIPTRHILESRILSQIIEFQEVENLLFSTDSITSVTIHGRDDVLKRLASLNKRYPQIVTLKIMYAKRLLIEGNRVDAIKILNEVMVEEPSEEEPYHLMSAIFIQEGKYLDGIALLDKILQVNPDCVLPYVQKAKIYEEMLQYSEALSMYEMALGNLSEPGKYNYEITDPMRDPKSYIEKKIIDLKIKLDKVK